MYRYTNPDEIIRAIQSGQARRQVSADTSIVSRRRPQARPGQEEDPVEQNKQMIRDYLEMIGATPEVTPQAPETSLRPQTYGDVVYSQTKLEDNDVDYRTLAVGLKEAADELGMDVVDLATIVSYETGGTFNPTKGGPTTKWGKHRGLIQFGEPQAEEYGVSWDDPYGSQLGSDGAIVRYFRENGYKSGMGLLDAYSIVNAGAPGLYDRSDEAAGGAPGTVRDKVYKQMEGHRAKARRLVNEYLGEKE